MCTVMNQSLLPDKFGSLIGWACVTCFISGGKWWPSPQATWTVSGSGEICQRWFRALLGNKWGKDARERGIKTTKIHKKMTNFISFSYLQSIMALLQHALLLPMVENWTGQVSVGTISDCLVQSVPTAFFSVYVVFWENEKEVNMCLGTVLRAQVFYFSTLQMRDWMPERRSNFSEEEGIVLDSSPDQADSIVSAFSPQYIFTSLMMSKV